MTDEMKWRVISPDGIPITPETFPSEEAARQALTVWCKRFEGQGYYSAVDGRIPLALLPEACEIEMVRDEEED
jgi:hypothetical protein